jgi:DNA-binding NtrC family response regulator
MKKSVLVIDRNEILRDQLYSFLAFKGYRVGFSKTGQEAINCYRGRTFDVIILDVSLDDAETLLREFLNFSPQPIVFVTATDNSLVLARKLCAAGAFGVFRKPFERDKVQEEVARAMNIGSIKASLPTRTDTESVIRALPPTIIEILSKHPRLPRSRSSVLIVGERGTEKEVLARTFHELSPRKEKPFVPLLDIAGELAQSLEKRRLEKTLRTGVLGQIDGGSIFIEEVSTLSLELQTRLLRILRDSDIAEGRRKASQYVDIRVFAGSEKDLVEAVAHGTFLRELFYKLAAVQISILPLRDRPADVLFWARQFLRRFRREHQIDVSDELTPDTCNRLVAYAWPDNLPELENVIERAVLQGNRGKLTVNDISFIAGISKTPLRPTFETHAQELSNSIDLGSLRLRQNLDQWSRDPKVSNGIDLPVDFDEEMRRHEVDLIRRALSATNGHQSKAARLLRMNPTTLNSKIKKYRIQAANLDMRRPKNAPKK